MNEIKQVRVDNWGAVFLQRLQVFFSRTDYCDLTLQFDGNVQLKVHRLVINTCTDYFQFLEENCTVDENLVLMPPDMQEDVIVPIVNFIYTGMLEFEANIFEKLYNTAKIMNISILTKLLDAQRPTIVGPITRVAKRRWEEQIVLNSPVKKKNIRGNYQAKLPTSNKKAPTWKRTPVSFQSSSNDVKVNANNDAVHVINAVPKPTRFEWPEETDLTSMNIMENSFEEISYTSKPLLTKKDDIQKDEATEITIDIEDVKTFINQTDGSTIESIQDANGIHAHEISNNNAPNQSTNIAEATDKKSTKPRISISSAAASTHGLNHNQIVAEILKKYPELMKGNKNIKLKILKGREAAEAEQKKLESSKAGKQKKRIFSRPRNRGVEVIGGTEAKDPWVCSQCSTANCRVEFFLYYLYRKHMTDVHNETFDMKLCMHCGHRSEEDIELAYHMYVKHGIKPQVRYDFLKCGKCLFIGLTADQLSDHEQKHSADEQQCSRCRLWFKNVNALITHLQITGHAGKNDDGRLQYDCQYCSKRFSSDETLFCHVRLQHTDEAKRDGIVSIEAMNEAGVHISTGPTSSSSSSNNNSRNYMLPATTTAVANPASCDETIHIISNDTVTPEDDGTKPVLPLEPSSEADSLNKVASGIATSLGLVDIVVINDDNNQQQPLYVDTESDEHVDKDEPEYLLSNLVGHSDVDQTSSGAATDVNTAAPTNAAICTTDELVMVLTDQDNPDDDDSGDNTNFVVLYSHEIDAKGGTCVINDDYLDTNNHSIIIKSDMHLDKSDDTVTTDTTITKLPTNSNSGVKTRTLQQSIEIDNNVSPDLQNETSDANSNNANGNSNVSNDDENSNNNNIIKKCTNGDSTSNPIEENTVECDDNCTTSPTTNSEKVEDVCHAQESVENEDNNGKTSPYQQNEADQTVTENDTRVAVNSECVVATKQKSQENSSAENNVHKSPQCHVPCDNEKNGIETVSTCGEVKNNEETALKENQGEDVKVAILDDWDDTEMQHSKAKSSNTISVHKIMDDWTEEEDTATV